MAANQEEENTVKSRNNRGKTTKTKAKHEASKIKVCPIINPDN